MKSGRNTRIKILINMKQLFLLAMFSFMFFSCVDKKAEVQEEVIIEEVDTTLLEETETL